MFQISAFCKKISGGYIVIFFEKQIALKEKSLSSMTGCFLLPFAPNRVMNRTMNWISYLDYGP